MIYFPENTKEIIDEIRGTIGREIVIFNTVQGEGCPTCSVDTLTGRSIDPFCPVCSGVGYINTVSGTTVTAHVLWNTVDTRIHLPVGRVYTGDCKATVEYTPEVLALIEDADYFLVDDKKLYLIGYDLRGVQEINRIAISLKQDPRNG